MGTKGIPKTFVFNPDVPERGTRPTHKQYHEPSTHAELMDHQHIECIYMLRRINKASSLPALDSLSEEKNSLLSTGHSLLHVADTHSSRFNLTFRSGKENLENSLSELSHQYRRKGIQLLEERRRLLASPHPVKSGDSFAQRLAKKIISECRALNRSEKQEDYIPRSISHASRSQVRFEATESEIPLETLISETQEEEEGR